MLLDITLVVTLLLFIVNDQIWFNLLFTCFIYFNLPQLHHNSNRNKQKVTTVSSKLTQL